MTMHDTCEDSFRRFMLPVYLKHIRVVLPLLMLALVSCSKSHEHQAGNIVSPSTGTMTSTSNQQPVSPIRNACSDQDFETHEENTPHIDNLPGAAKFGRSFATLKDGRILAVGGDPTGYRACKGCVASAYVYDLQKSSFQEVAPMNLARSYASATTLADGRVLVVGGLVDAVNVGGWGTPTDRVEVYDPIKNSWEEYPHMPAPSSEHGAQWLDPERKGQLLVGGGSNPQIQVLDVGQKRWQTAGETKRYLYGKRLTVFHDVRNGQPCLNIFGEKGFENVPLRLPSRSTAGESSIFLSRIPALALGNGGVYAVGGSYRNAEPDNFGNGTTASVDFYDPEHHTLTSLPTLNQRRGRGSAVFLANKRLLIVSGGGYKTEISGGSLKTLPMEYWQADKGDEGWHDLLGGGDSQPLLFDNNASVTQFDDSSLLVLYGDYRVERMMFDHLPAATHEALPNLLLPRKNATLRRLADGRIIIAGGTTPKYMLAVYDENAPETAETVYEGRGGFIDANDYEIFDPQTQHWRVSAPLPNPSHSIEGYNPFAILDDGRVVAVTMEKVPTQCPDGFAPGITCFDTPLMISDAEGTHWEVLPLPSTEPVLPSPPSVAHPVALPQPTDSKPIHPFVQSGELFVFGFRKTPVRYSIVTDVVWWYDREQKMWQEIYNFKDGDLPKNVLLTLTTPNKKPILWFRMN